MIVVSYFGVVTAVSLKIPYIVKSEYEMLPKAVTATIAECLLSLLFACFSVSLSVVCLPA